MNKVIEEINSLRLDILAEDWVQGIYYSEFLEFGEIPSEYEEVLDSLDIKSAFKSIMKAINSWLSEDLEEDKSWAALSHQVSHEKFLAILAYYIDYGTKNVYTKEYRNNALLACRVYYKLLSIPGYKAYHIYHSQLFAQSLACLSYPKAMCDNENNYYDTKELVKEVNSVIRQLQLVVYDLRMIIESLQLSSRDMNFEDILSNLVDITGGAIVNKHNVDKLELANVSRIIYEMIDILLCDANGVPDPDAFRLLFKSLLPKLIAASVDSKNANNLVRASYVTYSGLLLSKYGKPALNGYTVLLQHLCYTQDGLERAEVRQARVSLVVGLMSLLPRKCYRQTVRWLLKLSATAKISHRQIAIEMLANLLSNDPEEEKPPENPEKEKEPEQTENPEPVSDQAPEGSNPTEEVNPDNGGPTGDEQPKQEPQKSNLATDDDSSQDSQLTAEADPEITEDDVAGLLRQRPHTVPYSEILHALYERVNDVSSTLRTRSLQILTECLSMDREPMQQAIKSLNGEGPVSRLMAVAARGVCDERAAVRKAALALVQKSLSAPPNQDHAHSHDLGILVGLCRDASIIVRSAAIAALGELVLQRPCETFFDAFLSGPVHQLSDPEVKVQDLVVSLIQNILFNRIYKYVEGGTEDLLPWMFLAGVTRNNMRRHLQKACYLLSKSSSGCLNHRLVDILSTHLGSSSDARDLHCLILLTSISRHVDCNDIGFVLDYYYKLAESAQERDVRLMPLVVELLTVWSRWARPDERTNLRDHLVTRLTSATQDGCRLASATLAAHLDPHNLHWATELMQIAERRALSSTDVEEWVRAADLSLVAPQPPSPALVELLLNAIQDPPSEWSSEESGVGSGVKAGVAVAALGRLCVRSRGAAERAARGLAGSLRAGPRPARSNALLALTDIAARYTCIVEPLLDCVCDCLSHNSDAILRRTAARSLTKLFLGGFLRLRTPLYYKYCALLADDDHDVREPAEYYVTSCLTADTIYHHFVDSILYYNKEDAESLSFDSRQLIYDVMLQRLSIVQKLNVQCRLAREVLEHAADVTDEGDGEIPPSLNAALLDTITLLCGPRMKLPKKPQRDGEAADIDDLQERVTTNIVSHKMKRTVAEVLVPAVLRLYSRVGPRGGQVAAYLVRIATDLLNDYRHEIEELIEIDEGLVGRVRQFQETIGLAPSFGNSRNLVTASTAHEPDTPRASRKRAHRHAASPPRKRALRI